VEAFFSSISSNKAQNNHLCTNSQVLDTEDGQQQHYQTLMSLKLTYSSKELKSYTTFRTMGGSAATVP
jgi:hypothetical protein